MSMTLQYMPARITEDPYADHAPLWDLAASVCQTVIELEETEPLLWPPSKAYDDIGDLYEELRLLQFGPDATQFDRRDKAEQIMVACARFIRDVCGDR